MELIGDEEKAELHEVRRIRARRLKDGQEGWARGPRPRGRRDRREGGVRFVLLLPPARLLGGGTLFGGF